MNQMYTMFEANKDMEKNGIVLDYGFAKFRIARAGGSNARYAATLAHVAKPYNRAIQNEMIAPEKVTEIMREVYAKAVVIGWEDVKDREGNPMEFSYENCIKLFSELPDLFEDIQKEAQKLANFRLVVLDSVAKN